MSALTFDKNELGNLEYSLQREVLSTDRRGGYMSTTIVCCNTRRYHGLMVAPIGRGDQTCVLLSSLDETIVQHDQSFNLAIHRFRGVYEPRGHKYITDFAYTPTPTITYRVGGVILRKELLWIHKRTQLMIRYTLLDSPADIRLRLRPFFAYREKEALTHANMEANGRSYPVQGGVKNRLYEGYPWLYLQTNRPDAEFVAAPDWYYGFEYPQELARGYDGYEDLLTTGYFELPLSKGQSVIFSASVEEMASSAEIGALFRHVYERLLLDLERGDERSPIFGHHIAEIGRHLAHYGRRYEWERDLDLTVCDFISSMTDDYFMALCDLVAPGGRTLFAGRGYLDGVDEGWAREARRS